MYRADIRLEKKEVNLITLIKLALKEKRLTGLLRDAKKTSDFLLLQLEEHTA